MMLAQLSGPFITRWAPRRWGWDPVLSLFSLLRKVWHSTPAQAEQLVQFRRAQSIDDKKFITEGCSRYLLLPVTYCPEWICRWTTPVWNKKSSADSIITNREPPYLNINLRHTHTHTLICAKPVLCKSGMFVEINKLPHVWGEELNHKHFLCIGFFWSDV